MSSVLTSGASCVLVGLVWGATNPFVKRGSLKVEAKKARSGRQTGWLAELAALVTTPAFLVPQALNQCGSVLFVLLLGGANISVVVPLVNAASLASNAVVDVLLGERFRLGLLVPGLALVALGLALCATA